MHRQFCSNIVPFARPLFRQGLSFTPFTQISVSQFGPMKLLGQLQPQSLALIVPVTVPLF